MFQRYGIEKVKGRTWTLTRLHQFFNSTQFFIERNIAWVKHTIDLSFMIWVMEGDRKKMRVRVAKPRVWGARSQAKLGIKSEPGGMTQ